MIHESHGWEVSHTRSTAEPPTHTDNPLSYSLTQAQPLGRVIDKFSRTDSIMPPDSIKQKQKHLTICVESNCAQTANFEDRQMLEKKACGLVTAFLWHLHTQKMTKIFALKACLENRGMKMHFVLLIKYRICPTFSMTQNPTPPMQEKKKREISIMGKPTVKPICSASAKNNRCQVHQRAGLKRSSHFITEVGSSRVGLTVNAVQRSAGNHSKGGRKKKRKSEEMSWPCITERASPKHNKTKLQHNVLLKRPLKDTIGQKVSRVNLNLMGVGFIKVKRGWDSLFMGDRVTVHKDNGEEVKTWH